jgi:hypothetical protein
MQFFPNKQEHLRLSDYQKQLLKVIRKLSPQQPLPPWKSLIVIPGAGIISAGWTAENNVLLVSHSKYTITNPHTGERRDDTPLQSVYTNISKNNLQFQIPETNEFVDIFGTLAGDGNHVSSDGWQLEVIYPAWPNSIVLIRRQEESPPSTLQAYQQAAIIKLHRLEYLNLKAGFSPDERLFMIVNSAGAEVFYR